MDIVAVVNLKARHGSAAVVAKLRAELPAARVLASRTLDEARQFVGQGPPPGLLVSAGGDGTAIGLLNTFAGRLPSLGVLRLGTGNGWARATGAPAWRTAIEEIGRYRADLPLSTYELLAVDGILAHFAGTGWDAEIIDDFHEQQSGRGLLPRARRQGLAGYLQGVFTRTIPRNLMAKPAEVELIDTGSDALGVDAAGRSYPIKGGEHGAVLYRGPAGVCGAGTSTEWGFGFKAFPFARLVPGRFCLRVYSGGPLDAAANMFALWKGTHPMPRMHTWLLDACQARFSRPVPFQAGGDRRGHRSAIEYRLADRTVDVVDWRALSSRA